MWPEGEVLTRLRRSLDSGVRALNSPNVSKAVLRKDMADVIDESKLLIGSLMQDGGVISHKGAIAVHGFSSLETNSALSEAVRREIIMRARSKELERHYQFKFWSISGWHEYYLLSENLMGSLGYEFSPQRNLRFVLSGGGSRANALLGELANIAFPELISSIVAKRCFPFPFVFAQSMRMAKAILCDLSNVMGQGNLSVTKVVS